MKPSRPQKIAILNPGAGLGDHIMTLPAIQTLKSLLPGTQVDLITNGKTNCIADIMSEIDQFRALPTGNPCRTFFSIYNFLSNTKYDAVMYLGKSSVIVCLLFIIGIKCRIGYSTSCLSQLLLSAWLPLKNDLYIGEQHANLAKQLVKLKGFPLSECWQSSIPSLGYKFDEVKKSALAASLQSKSSSLKIMIHPGFSLASQKRRYLKAWPTEYWCQLIQEILITYPTASIYLLGGPDDYETLENLAKFSKTLAQELQTRIHNLSGQTKNIRELAYTIYQGTILISVDSFPMHLGISIGKPVLAIFASTNEKNYLPQISSVSSISRSDLSCRPCLWTIRKQACLNPICLQVPVNKVMQQLTFMLNNILKHKSEIIS